MIKEARRQAYRYGRQLSVLEEGTVEYERVRVAWQTFISQFDALEPSDTFAAYVKSAFTGSTAGDTVTDVAMGFTLGLPDQDN